MSYARIESYISETIKRYFCGVSQRLQVMQNQIDNIGGGTTPVKLMTIVSNAPTLPINDDNNVYVFTGTTSTWTVDPVAGSIGSLYKLTNRGTGNLTVNSTGGANEFYNSGVVDDTFILMPGESAEISSDGVYYIIKNQ